MRFGIAFFVTDETIAPGELARTTESAGFESLFVTEHTHMPVEHSEHPLGDLPTWYKRTLDPFVVLAAAAEATTTLRLGFGVLLAAQHDPITTAKAVASLDHLSGGRVDLGIGAGWNEPEFTNHGGRPFDRRFKILREHVEAMRAIWTQEEAAYDGEFVRFGPLWSWPKPVQERLPVYVGGNGTQTLARVLRYGDHWMPNREEGLAGKIADLRSRAADAGRSPQVAYFGVAPERETIERFAGHGVDVALLIVKSDAPTAVEDAIGRAGELAREYA